MSFSRWYLRRGRITRSTFWLHYVLPIVVVSLVAGTLDQVLGLATFDLERNRDGLTFASTVGPISGAFALLTIVPSISSTVTRLHDRGHSAWWLLFLLIPLIGFVVLLVQCGFLEGERQPNAHGPPVGLPPVGSTGQQP